MVSKDPAFITLPSPRSKDFQSLYPQILPGPSTAANMYHPSQSSAPQSPPMHHPSQAGGLQHYPPPPGSEAQPPPTSNQYSQYSYDTQLKFPQGEHQNGGHHPQHHYPPPPTSHGLPLPSMSQALPPIQQGAYPPPPPPQEMLPDTTGQIAPPGSKPRVTATLWEDEGTLCFQVDVKGTCVARREDNHMINGTKLLNVAGMTRGRRDGILKAEKQKHVVKIGPMHLKGVWIPFEKALEFANKEKITEMLYPLFVHNIGALLYHPSNQAPGGARGFGPSVGMARMDGGGGQREWERRESVQSVQSVHSQQGVHSPIQHQQQQSPVDYRHDYANDQRLASEQLQQQQQQQQQQQRMFDHFPVQGS